MTHRVVGVLMSLWLRAQNVFQTVIKKELFQRIKFVKRDSLMLDLIFNLNIEFEVQPIANNFFY